MRQPVRQGQQTTRYSSPTIVTKTDRFSHRLVAGTQLSQRRESLPTRREGTSSKPVARVDNPRVDWIVDVGVGKHMNARRQWADTQPVAAVYDERIASIGTKKVTTRVASRFQFTGCPSGCLGRVTAAQQVAGEQPSAARSGRQLRLLAIGDRDKHPTSVHAQPGAAMTGIDPADSLDDFEQPGG